MHRGSCLCGSVAFTVAANLQGASACHCTQCRKQSGHHWASATAPDADFELTRSGDLRWFASSETAKRGFCASCGSFLFWKHNAETKISISMSAFDTTTGLTLTRNIFTDTKGDYYDLPAVPDSQS
ncbi:MAG: GFA family protein [Sedimentitalea sp.]